MKLNYFIIPLITIITSLSGSWFTNKGMDWYNKLKLPDFTPPGSVIGIVWTIIFILTTISALIVWNKFDYDNKFWLIIGLFILNAILNALWSFIFFYSGQIGPAIIEMLVLEATVIGLIVLIWPLSKLAAGLLIPYSAWVLFATYLAYSIWNLNK